MKSKKLNFILIGVILILVIIITFTLSSSKDFQMEIDGLEKEISERKDKIQELEFDIKELNAVDNIRRRRNEELQSKIDSILEISYEKHNPKNDPIPKSSARNDSIVKWSKYFQRRND